MSQTGLGNEEQPDDIQLQKAKTAYRGKSADEYHSLRPRYSPESVNLLLRKLNILDEKHNLVQRKSTTTIVDLGCGTGLLTEVVLKALQGAGVRVIATDPVESMEKTFLEKMKDYQVEFVSCKAETMPFPDGSVTAIIAGTSFHWFATQEAYQQIHRVLEPNGRVGYIVNALNRTDPNRPEWVKDVLHLVWESYKKTNAPHEHTFKWRDAMFKSDLFEEYQEDFSLKQFQDISLEGCVKMCASYGGVASGGELHKQEFETNLRNVLKGHFLDKNIKFPGIEYISEIYTFKKK